MVAKLCKYCNVQMLEGFDEVERKFYEKGTRTLHTRERCEAIRASQGGGNAQIYTKPTGMGGGGISNTTIAEDLLAIHKQLDSMESKIDKALAQIRGQDTLDREGNE